MDEKREPGPQKGDELELEIEKIVPGGDGLARHDGRVVFVPLAAPGDRLKVEVVKKKKAFLRAKIVEILSSGKGRRQPVCRLFGLCGGCQFQHLNRETERAIKREMVADALFKIAKLEVEVAPVREGSPETDYRQRAGLKARVDRGEVKLGFFQAGGRNLIDLPACPILHPELEGLLETLRAAIRRLERPYAIQEVETVWSESGLGLVFHLKSGLSQGDRNLLKQFGKRAGIKSLWQGGKTGKEWRPLLEEGELTYTLEGMPYRFLPGDFTQANIDAARILAEEAMALAGEGEKAVDLFCGGGMFTLPLARRYAHVAGYEVSFTAIKSAKRNARENGLGDKATFERLDLSPEEGDVALNLEGVETVLLDPPRTGAEAVARRLVDSDVKRVVYVSCDPATFARDAALLTAGGFTLEKVQPVDLFPLTRHVELVAGFKRKA